MRNIIIALLFISTVRAYSNPIKVSMKDIESVVKPTGKRIIVKEDMVLDTHYLIKIQNIQVLFLQDTTKMVLKYGLMMVKKLLECLLQMKQENYRDFLKDSKFQ